MGLIEKGYVFVFKKDEEFVVVVMLLFVLSEWDWMFWGDDGYEEFIYLYCFVVSCWFVG